jgi:archaellum component FlaF (FlaF/FlaG flagellin family)
MYTKRRGVSEIISTIMIILIVSIAGSYLFVYATGLFQKQQDDFIKTKELSTVKAQERFKVTAIWWSGTNDLLNISVYNYGIHDIEINDVYIDGIRVKQYTFGRNIQLKTEDILQIAFDSPISIVPGRKYSIILVTSNGVSKKIEWGA